MFAKLASSPRVRSSSTTNTQGLPSHRLTYIAFAELEQACPLELRYHAGRRIMNQLTGGQFTACVGIDWADAKHDICK